MVIEKTQDLVFEKIENRLKVKDALQLFVAETGTGKTTGAQLAMAKLWKERSSDIKFLVMVPTRKDADKYWQGMEDIEHGCAAVWTQVHDPSDSTTADFTPSCRFTKEQAKRYPCLIITHNAGKAAEGWVGERDAVLIDEYPQPVSSGVVRPWQFIRARDEECSDPYLEAAIWAEEDKEAGKGLEPAGVPDWVPMVVSCAKPPAGEAGREVLKLAQHMNAGTAFRRRIKKTVNWVYYNYDLPFEEKAIIFSATAHMEGWHYDPACKSGKIDKGTVRVDYKNMTAKYVPWPEGVSRYHKDIIANREQREQFTSYVADQVGYAGSKTLFVVPKVLESDIRAAVPPDTKITHWGCDVGSNEYRDCTDVWLISLFHQPKDILYAKYLGHAKMLATDETLKAGQNTNSSEIRQLEALHHATQIKQMAARGSCRSLDSKGVASEMSLNCLFPNVDIFTSAVPAQFPGVQLEYPPTTAKGVGPKRQNKPVTTKIAEHLTEVPPEKDEVTASELAKAGIIIKGSRKKRLISASKEIYEGLGWEFDPGPVKGGRGQSSCFKRVMAVPRDPPPLL